jgi:GNAT superfamily N-acetyltransferase
MEHMTILRERDGIRYALLGEPDLDEVARLVAVVFADGSEPVTRALGVGPDDFVEFVRSLGPKFSQEGLSVVARDIATGKALGAQLNDDMGIKPPESIGAYDWIVPALALLEALDHGHFGDRAIEPGECVHLFLIAVLRQFRRERISSQLLELSLGLAAKHGYGVAVAEATGLVSQHMLRKAGFQHRVEIPYATFEHGGQRPFEGIKDHPSAVLMEKMIARQDVDT